MSRFVVLFLLVISQMLALLLALLGFETRSATPVGWFLVLVGIGFLAGVGIFFSHRKQHLWEMELGKDAIHPESNDHTSWLIILGMMTAFFLSPLEYINLSIILPRNSWISSIGLVLAILGAVLVVWVYRVLGNNFSGYLSLKTAQVLVQNGPYRFIRHPAYAGYILMALGVSLGYSSLIGLISTVVFLLPSLVYRINLEEDLLTEKFGEAYPRYASKVKRLFPGIW